MAALTLRFGTVLKEGVSEVIGLPTACLVPDSSSLVSAAEALGLGGEGEVMMEGDTTSGKRDYIE